MIKNTDPFVALRTALQGKSDQQNKILSEDQGRLDTDRLRRRSIPDIIRAESKEVKIVADILAHLADINGRSLAYKCSPAAAKEIKSRLSSKYEVIIHDVPRMIVVAKFGIQPKKTGGRVGIITAGTSDIPIAEEAAIVATEMGATVTRIWDVGVAGLHRLIRPLEDLIKSGVDVIIVAAGMDGALAPVVTGLVKVPVIGLPTSIGHGFGGEGISALSTMLQSCALGITVVNIDNGVAAGISAALIANQMAEAREKK